MTSQGTVITAPVPPFQNFPIESQFYQPSQFFISAITLGVTTTITTSVNHNYVPGQTIRLLIPPSFGSYQLNESLGPVLSIPTSNQVVVSIDSSRNVDPYIASSAKMQQAQIVAVGDINNGQINANGINSTLNYIQGSFINISPL